MRLYLPDGSILETRDPDEIEQITGLLGLRPAHKTQADQMRATLDEIKATSILSDMHLLNNAPSPDTREWLREDGMVETRPQPAAVALADRSFTDELLLTEDDIYLPPRRKFRLFLPVTEREHDALVIMRKDKTKEWTGTEVCRRGRITNPERRQSLMGAISQLRRSGRGVIHGRNRRYYYLTEFGREAELIDTPRPAFWWPSMLKAAQEGRDWKESDVS